MKTPEQKAEEWLKKNKIIYSTETVNDLAKMLKQQDRDTRHACAEMVGSMSGYESPTGGEVLYADEVSEAIMNCSAGVKP